MIALATMFCRFTMHHVHMQMSSEFKKHMKPSGGTRGDVPGYLVIANNKTFKVGNCTIYFCLCLT